MSDSTLTQIDKAVKDRGYTLYRSAKNSPGPVKFAIRLTELGDLISQATDAKVNSDVIALMTDGYNTLEAAKAKLTAMGVTE